MNTIWPQHTEGIMQELGYSDEQIELVEQATR